MHFFTDFLSLARKDIQAEKQWWIATFDCKEGKIPADWDDPLPSDVALKLPGADAPTILLSDHGEFHSTEYRSPNEHPIVFCSNLAKAHEFLRHKNIQVGPIQDGRGPQFFQIHDPEGNVIEICKQP